MIKLNYVKNKNNYLFKSLEKYDFENIQNYIPLYNHYFELNETNWNNINLNHKFTINDIVEKKNDNEYTIKVDNNEKKESYFKLSPLIEPDKYLNGNFKDICNNLLYQLPKYNIENKCISKYNNFNNASYIDCFFSFLSSKLKYFYNFPHGLDFYGSFLALKRDYKYNIADDLEILHHSDFFLNNNGIIYTISDNVNKMMNFDTRKCKEPLKLSNTLSNLSINSINNYNDLFIDNSENTTIINLNEIDELNSEYNYNIENNSQNISTEYDSNSSITYYSSHNSSGSIVLENNSDINDDDNSLDGNKTSTNNSLTTSESSLFDDEYIECIIKKFPVQIICLEKLKGTLDDYMNNNEIQIDEWKAIFLQIIMILITYQKIFDFTHNDLHTNNIMYIETERQFLYYKINNTYYKVPTYGKIFKIIDFGRAIYKFNGKTLISDSYSEKGDAATQYNFPPYYNEKKPLLEPNKSFDLCRLACSLYDNFIGEKEDIEFDEIDNLIDEWCKDDKQKNILYKSNGDERYPGFKLYKMISRKVNHHIPINQLNKKIFNDFKISHKKIKNVKQKYIINIDEMPLHCQI
jgi:hypothetical protein